MFNILTLNKIAKVGIDKLGDGFNCSSDVSNPDGVLVRSASMHEFDFNDNMLAIARAGAGVNNIPLTKCSDLGITVFNTPGANANAVKELVIAGLLISSRKVIDGIEWAKTLKGNGSEVGKLVEKGKSSFAGPEIKGKKLGVIGLGAIGVLVANAAEALGMEVYGYDPYLSINAAWTVSPGVKRVNTLDEIYAVSDYITIHVPLNDATRAMVCAESIAKMKDGVRILNFARDGLVNSTDILAGLESKKIAAYVTDFATDDILCADGVIALPHLGASTPESEDNCAVMAAQEIKSYLLDGNIKNSVNMPCLEMPRSGDKRICVIYKSDALDVTAVCAKITESGLKIANMESKGRNGISYTVVDVAGQPSEELKEQITAIGAIKVRVI